MKTAGPRGRSTAASPSPSRSTSRSRAQNAAYQVGFDLLSGDGLVLRSWHTDGPPDDWPPLSVGRSTLRCVIPAGMLNEGSYAVAPRADVYRSHWIVNGDEAVWFDVVKDHLESPFSWVRHPGPISPLLDWRMSDGGEEVAEPRVATGEDVTPSTPPV